MTVSDGERLRRGSLTNEERAQWAVKAWRLADRGNMSFRQIEEHFARTEGFIVSHVTIRKWVNEARNQAAILELYEASQVRLDLLGKLEHYRDSIQAAIDTGEIGFEPGMKLLLGVTDRISKLTNAPVAPTSKVEVTTASDVSPNMVLLQELKKASDHAKKMAEMEENDGLG